MESRARLAANRLYPMVLATPIGLWLLSVICDLVSIAGGGEVWATVAFYNVAAGLVCAAMAVVAGALDLPVHKRQSKTGVTQLVATLGAISLLAVSLGMRLPDVTAPPLTAYLLSLMGFATWARAAWRGSAPDEVDDAGADDRIWPTPERSSASASTANATLPANRNPAVPPLLLRQPPRR